MQRKHKDSNCCDLNMKRVVLSMPCHETCIYYLSLERVALEGHAAANMVCSGQKR